eukprot:scaffold3822_cov181-Amphora_coffeaeformis.AAC.3
MRKEDEDDSNNENENTKTKPSQERILIIGAGYAGLTLANLLLHPPRQARPYNNSNDNDDPDQPWQRVWSVDVIDRLHPPPPDDKDDDSKNNIIHGTIRVPFAKHLLPEMPSLDATRVQSLLLRQQASKTDHDKDRLPETELLRILRDKIHVHYHHEAQNIRVQFPFNNKNSDGEHDDGDVVPPPARFVEVRQKRKLSSSSSQEKKKHSNENNNHITNDDNDDEIVSWWGPYDWVIAADGALSKFRHPNVMSSLLWWFAKTSSVGCCSCSCPQQRVLLLGDAQWVHGRWWDLGTRRLNRGADVALRQAYELATAYLKSTKSANRCSSCGSVQDPTLYKFQRRSSLLTVDFLLQLVMAYVVMYTGCPFHPFFAHRRRDFEAQERK